MDLEINAFKLERYFARYEFNVKYLLSPSDCESISLNDLLKAADRETVELWNNLTLGYTESKGHPLLREEIAKLYQTIKPDNCIVAAPEEAIFIALFSLLRKDDEVIVVTPAYQSLIEIPRFIGCRVLEWEIEDLNNAWHLDLSFLERHINEKTRLIITNFPHNPTGYMPTVEEFFSIVELAGKHGTYLFSDEMYHYLEYEQACRLPPAADCYERAVSLCGLSKSFGLPGLRMGWLATADQDLMNRFAVWKDYTSICSSAPSEILSIAALRSRETIIKENIAIINHNLHVAQMLFDKYSSLLTWYEPQGGSIAFPRLTDKISVTDFCLGAVEKNNVLILSADVFSYPKNHFRVGLGRKSFPEACEALEDYLERL